MRRKILFSFMLILFAGCATVGKPMKETQLVQLKDGITTQEEVFELMGEPFNKTLTDMGEEKWIYIYSRSKPTWGSFIPYVGLFESGVVTKGQKLEIIFNEKKIVKKHIFSIPTTTMKTGILQ